MGGLLAGERRAAMRQANTPSRGRSSGHGSWRYCHTWATESDKSRAVESQRTSGTRLLAFRSGLSMPTPFKISRLVEFADTDMAGIMHFSAFFRFMEAAEH